MIKQDELYIGTKSEDEIIKSKGYQLSIKLGQGGYANVYLAHYKPPNRDDPKIRLACKIIDVKDPSSKFATKFLPQEIDIISNLNHPHIIQIHSIFNRNNKYYIFMRHAERGDLFDYICINGPIKEKQAKFWTRQISLAVQYLHILEIAHRDLKCENILITYNYNVKLADFDFARKTIDNNYQSILSETYCGSTSYASPQIINGEAYNPKATDMWSLGCIIYIMLNKAAPFSSANIAIMYDNQIAKKFKFREKYIHLYNKVIVTLINNLLEPNENIRYRIEQVLNSAWISMEPTLNTLNKYEFTSLIYAMEVAKCKGTSNTTDDRRSSGDNKLRMQSMKSVRNSIFPKNVSRSQS